MNKGTIHHSSNEETLTAGSDREDSAERKWPIICTNTLIDDALIAAYQSSDAHGRMIPIARCPPFSADVLV